MLVAGWRGLRSWISFVSQRADRPPPTSSASSNQMAPQTNAVAPASNLMDLDTGYRSVLQVRLIGGWEWPQLTRGS
jgi:hypothetical protein